MSSFLSSFLSPFVSPFASPLPRLLRLLITSADPVRDLHRLTGWALDNGIALDGLEVTRPSLEDVYLSLTGDQEAEA